MDDYTIKLLEMEDKLQEWLDGADWLEFDDTDGEGEEPDPEVLDQLPY